MDGGVRIDRGIIRDYDSTNHLADVEILGSMATVVEDVPVAHHVGGELLEDGVLCGVLFFAEGDPGLVVATWDGLPDAWVTPALLTSPAGWVTQEMMDWVVPGVNHDVQTGDQVLTTTMAVYGGLTQEVTVPSGQTLNVVALASVTISSTSVTGWNLRQVAIYKDAAQLGLQWQRSAVNLERNTIAVVGATTITADTTFTVKVRKTQARNTETALEGSLVLVWWEVAA